MTLDEIVAGMEHKRILPIAVRALPCSSLCTACQLIAFRAELEAMAQRWNEEADRKYFTDARFALQKTAEELRAKIGEKR